MLEFSRSASATSSISTVRKNDESTELEKKMKSNARVKTGHCHQSDILAKLARSVLSDLNHSGTCWFRQRSAEPPAAAVAVVAAAAAPLDYEPSGR